MSLMHHSTEQKCLHLPGWWRGNVLSPHSWVFLSERRRQRVSAECQRFCLLSGKHRHTINVTQTQNNTHLLRFKRLISRISWGTVISFQQKKLNENLLFIMYFQKWLAKGILNWVIGVVLDGVFNLSIGTIIDVLCSIVSKESRKDCCSDWRQLENKDNFNNLFKQTVWHQYLDSLQGYSNFKS